MKDNTFYGKEKIGFLKNVVPYMREFERVQEKSIQKQQKSNKRNMMKNVRHCERNTVKMISLA